MAYYGKQNPDALPAHAEPDQAAAAMRDDDHEYRYEPQGGRGGSLRRGGPPRPNPQQRPPQQNTGFASPPPMPGAFRPPSNAQARPPPASRPPPSPAGAAPPPPGADPTLWPLFKAVDKDGTGNLTEKELRAALVNGDWTSFDPQTVRMMIRMFDTNRDGTIGFNEFCGLWGFLAAWRSLFDRFDTDGSGNISLDEFSNALSAFGYRLSPQFVNILFRSYDRRGTEPIEPSVAADAPAPNPAGQNAISFDLFVQCCISLKRMTEVFKKYDEDRDGYITLSFEEFLTEILRQR